MDEAVPKKATKGKKAKPFTVTDAESDLLKKLETAGAKGKPSLFTAGTSKAEVYTKALAGLVERQEVFLDRSLAKPKYYLWRCRPKPPTPESVGEKVLAFALRSYPQVHNATALATKSGLAKAEKASLPAALKHLCEVGAIVELRYGTGKTQKALYLALAALPTQKGASTAQTIDEDVLRAAYDRLVTDTGFPAVPIASLQRASEIAMERLKEWLVQTHQAGEIVLSVGDWSLASEEERSGVLELHGRRYLQVRWL